MGLKLIHNEVDNYSGEANLRRSNSYTITTNLYRHFVTDFSSYILCVTGKFNPFIHLQFLANSLYCSCKKKPKSTPSLPGRLVSMGRIQENSLSYIDWISKERSFLKNPTNKKLEI